MVKKSVKITFAVPYVRALDHLVEEGIYLDYQAAIRDALRRLFRHYGIEPFYRELVEKVEKVQE